MVEERFARRIAAGPHVFLCHPSPADADDFLAAVRASRDLHAPWVQPPQTREQYGIFLERYDAPQHLSHLACMRETNALVGVFNLTEIVRGVLQSAYLGFYAFKPHAGQGHMTESLELLLSLAFRSLRLHRVEANIQPGNERSKALVRRVGFQQEGYSPRYLKLGGRWRDHERWAILQEDWKAR